MKQSNTTPSFEQLMADGFTEMRIIESNDTPCQFLLKSKDGTVYEVEEIQSRIPGMKANTNLYVKFTPLKRVSQCNAQPIKIEELHQ